jgi:isopentenyldiphosphate isomerase
LNHKARHEHPDLVVVDKHDRPVGQATFQVTRERGLHHRAVVVLALNSQGQVLLQKRGPHVKSPHLWDTSVGGHVDVGEDYLQAALRETAEEIGIAGEELQVIGTFFVDVHEGPEWIRQFVTAYTVIWDKPVIPNPEEVTEVKWISIPELGAWIQQAPGDFTRVMKDLYSWYLESIVLAEA